MYEWKRTTSFLVFLIKIIVSLQNFMALQYRVVSVFIELQTYLCNDNVSKKKKKIVFLISHQVGDQVQQHVTLLTIESKYQGNVRWRSTEFIWNSVNVIFIPDWVPSASLENPELVVWSVTIRNIKSLGTSICCVSCCLDLAQQHL